MVRLDRTIQKPLKRLEEKSFIDARQGVLDPLVEPEDDEKNTCWNLWKDIVLNV